MADWPIDPNAWIDRVLGASSAPTTAAENVPRVYMGMTTNTGQELLIEYQGPTRRRPRGTVTPDTDTPNIQQGGRRTQRTGVQLYGEDVRAVTDVQGMVYAWYGTNQFDAWGKYLTDLGLVDPEDAASIEVLDSVWQDAVVLAANLYTQGKKITPWQAAALLKGANSRNGSRYGAGFSGTKRSRSTSVDLTDPATAKALINDTLANALGRAATEEEVRAFTSVINTAERANPTVTETVTTYNRGEAVSQSSTRSGGITDAGRRQMTLDQATTLPEYGAFQAAATYYNALLGALDSPV